MKGISKKIKAEIKKIFSGVRVNLAVFSALAAAMVLLSFAIQYAGNYVFLPSNDVRNIQSWDYTYLDSFDSPVDSTKLANSNYVVPISKKGNTGICYLTHTFDKINEKTVLKIVTNHSPIKVVVNSQEVYNNHYGKEKYVANSFNSIELEKTNRSQKVEVYMSVPFSLNFEVKAVPVNSNQSELTPSFFVGAAVFGVGLIMLLVSLILSVKNKYFSRLVGVALFDILSGANIAFWQYLQNSYNLNAPIYYNISLAPSLIVVYYSSLSALSEFKNLSKLCKALVALSGISIFLCEVPSFPPALRIAPVLLSFLLVCSLFAASSSFVNAIGRRIKGANADWFLSNYIIAVQFILQLQLFFGKTKYYVVFNVLVALLYTIVMTMIKYDRSSVKYNHNKKQKEQFIGSLGWVNSLDSMMSNILAQDNDEDKLTVCAEEFKQIITNSIKPESELAVSACILASDGRYYQIYSDNLDEICNFNLIGEHYKNDGGTHHVLWGDTYFDVIIDKNYEPYAIIHFEGADDLLSLNIENVVETISADLDVVMNLTDDEIQNEEFEAGVFASLSQNVEVKNGVAKNHLENVSNITFCICAMLGLSEDEIRQIGYASMLHDIGKVVIPSELISKQGYLTEEEKEIMKLHAECGYKLLSCIEGDFTLLAGDIAHYHHEKIDGSGYYNLKGDEIPLAARIVSVADVFDALTSSRSYKTAWTDEKAMEYLKENSGSAFDENVVNAFLECYPVICELRKGGDN